MNLAIPANFATATNARRNCMYFSGETHHERLRDEDDELLQFAIQQSLLEAGTENDQVCSLLLCFNHYHVPLHIICFLID